MPCFSPGDLVFRRLPPPDGGALLAASLLRGMLIDFGTAPRTLAAAARN